MISFNVLFFWVTILFVFWLGSLAAKKARSRPRQAFPAARRSRQLVTNPNLIEIMVGSGGATASSLEAAGG